MSLFYHIYALVASLLCGIAFSLFKRIVVNGESYSEVATEFGLSEPSCRKRVERIIKKLRKNWGDEK